ncbi:hypothetical protein GSB9_03212 [Flavobacteriaceae bacterium GSB9]|nr:hypothetical protein GSB9_03212 [Flavobacteriaceae bacterium GSB9]
MKNKTLTFLNKYGLILGGVFMILVSLIIIRNGYLDKKITERNKTVDVKIIDCYDSGRSNYFLKFKFNGKTFVKRTKAKYCEEIKGAENFKLLTNENNDRFIFQDEYETDNDFLYGFILIGVASIIIIKAYKTLKKQE